MITFIAQHQFWTAVAGYWILSARGFVPQQDATLSGILLRIIARAIQAYHDHTGETLDPSLIKPEQVL
jgi:hypothetical protein